MDFVHHLPVSALTDLLFWSWFLFQALTFEEEATISTCNLSETVHNKWLQASGNKMIDVYHATVNDFSRAALQSLIYFNYLRGRSSGTGPNKFELELRLAS